MSDQELLFDLTPTAEQGPDCTRMAFLAQRNAISHWMNIGLGSAAVSAAARAGLKLPPPVAAGPQTERQRREGGPGLCEVLSILSAPHPAA